jgi:hypothetical protein
MLSFRLFNLCDLQAVFRLERSMYTSPLRWSSELGTADPSACDNAHRLQTIRARDNLRLQRSPRYPIPAARLSRFQRERRSGRNGGHSGRREHGGIDGRRPLVRCSLSGLKLFRGGPEREAAGYKGFRSIPVVVRLARDHAGANGRQANE